eukprot:XP_001691404.1 predicted protein [Chlamydomonas reinhardtii]
MPGPLLPPSASPVFADPSPGQHCKTSNRTKISTQPIKPRFCAWPVALRWTRHCPSMCPDLPPTTPHRHYRTLTMPYLPSPPDRLHLHSMSQKRGRHAP